ncbi:hypothetical protein ACFQ51_42090 [Streptomyces kaempferi]
MTRARDQARDLQGRLDALATVAANLYAENVALRRRLRGRISAAAPGDTDATEQPLGPTPIAVLGNRVAAPLSGTGRLREQE